MIKQCYGAPLLILGLDRVRDGPGLIIQQEEVRVEIAVIGGGFSKASMTQQPGSREENHFSLTFLVRVPSDPARDLRRREPI